MCPKIKPHKFVRMVEFLFIRTRMKTAVVAVGLFLYGSVSAQHKRHKNKDVVNSKESHTSMKVKTDYSYKLCGSYTIISKCSAKIGTQVVLICETKPFASAEFDRFKSCYP